MNLKKRWKKSERRIGGTAISAICGESSFAKPIDVYQEIVEGKKLPDSLLLDAGRAMEPVIRAEYTRKTGFKQLVKKIGTVRHPTLDWMTASPDDVSDDFRVIDYKLVSIFGLDKWRGGPPQGYVIQLQWYMAVLGLERATLVGLMPNLELDIHELTADAELASDLIALGQHFWDNHIIPKIPPEPDGSESYSAFLRKRPLPPTEVIAPASDLIEIAIGQYGRTKRDLKAADEAHEKAKQELILSMGGATAVRGMTCDVRLSEYPTSRLDADALCKAYDIDDATKANYLKTSMARRLTVKERK